MKRSIKVANLLTGLETTGLEDGLELPRWAEFQNARVSQGAAKRRGGQQRVLVADDQYENVREFDGTEFITVPLNASQMQLGKYWTVETIFDVDSVSAQRTILDWDGASDARPLTMYVTTGSLLTAVVRTSGGTVTLTGSVTAGSTYRSQVVRSGTTVTLRISGTDVDTDTLDTNDCVAPPGDMYVGVDYTGAAAQFDGTIGYIRCLDIVLGDQKYSRSVLPDPKASFVCWEYVPQREGTPLRTNDRSRWRNHGYWSGSTGSVTNITQQSSPVSVIQPRLDNDDRARLDVVAGGKVYLGELTR